jgi:hypothetical protein
MSCAFCNYEEIILALWGKQNVASKWKQQYMDGNPMKHRHNSTVEHCAIWWNF